MEKLLHRYDFEGTGTEVTDRIGTADGVVAGGGELSSDDEQHGMLVLGGGGAGGYVDLPNGLVSSLSSATFEAWVTWGGGGNWQRIFDFGDSTAATPEDNPGEGNTYLFLTPSNHLGVLRAAFTIDGNENEVQVDHVSPLAQELKHIAVVADVTNDQLVLYLDGARVAESPWSGDLVGLNDVNVWLGRSQYDDDPEINGTYHEFRVYGAALTDAEVATSYAAGPDPVFLAYDAATALD